MMPTVAVGGASARHTTTLALRLAARPNLTPQAARAVLGSGVRGGVVVAIRPFSATRAIFVKKPSTSTDAKRKTLEAKKVKATKAKAAAAKKKKGSAKKPAKALKKKKTTANAPKKLTREQRARLRERVKKREAIQHRKDLKEASLIKEEPRMGAVQPFMVFSVERGPALRAKGLGVPEMAKQLGEEWRSLSAADVERYKQVAESNREASRKAYAAWVKKHTPAQIREANSARVALKRQGLIRRSPIKDDRLPSPAKHAYTYYMTDYLRTKRGEKPVKELFGEGAALWKGLGAAQKKPFEDMAAKDKKRYRDEETLVFG